MTKIGKVANIPLYEFDDGLFSFHTARSDGNASRVFRCGMDTWPSRRAAEMGITYSLLVNSTAVEVNLWLENHPEHVVKKVHHAV